jgi:ATP-dependent DNA helicase
LEEFEGWFDFSDLQSEGGSARLLSREQSQHVISTLRDILDPFILQREKKHVEKDLPPKKEYMLYAPLTQQQKELYDEVLNNSLRARLTELMTGLSWEDVRATEVHKGGEGWDPPVRSGTNTPNPQRKGQRSSLVYGSSAPASGTSTPAKRANSEVNGNGDANEGRRKARRSRRSDINYDIDEETEKQFMDRMEQGDEDQKKGGRSKRTSRSNSDDGDDDEQIQTIDVKQQSKEHAVRQAQKEIANMRLQNPIMQLRKICGHPFLLYWPQDPDTGEYLANEDLIYASGKMMMLNRLLDALWAQGHKVLIFSQFTTMIDILEDWADMFKGVKAFRIDGAVSVDERARLMKEFNNDKSDDACKLFLLSTRAGGLGVNLVAADTVIFYDTDWNPQVDRQAQDRAHRIGQTKPVLVFRLVTRDTAEERIVKRAFAKQQLSTLVMSGDQFSKQASDAASAFAKGGRGNSNRVDEWTALLDELKRESVDFEVADRNTQMISDENLEMLLDRSPATFERRQQGWTANADEKTRAKSKGGKTAKTAKTASGKSAFEVTDVLEAMEKEQDDVDYQPGALLNTLGESDEAVSSDN